MRKENQSTRGIRDISRSLAIGLASTAALLALLNGCANLDPQHVEHARTSVAAAEGDTQIDANTSLHLQEAKRHLVLAEKALKKGKWQEITDHHAYLADVNARSAEALAAARVADEESGAKMSRAQKEAERARLAVTEAAARAADLQRRANAMAQRADQMTAEQTERGLVLTLGGVLFAFDSDELKADTQLATARLAGFLIALGDREVIVEGYTDNSGPAEYNLGLSKRRAVSVRDMLVANGVEADRIAADGYGMEFPVAPNDTDMDRAKNRRVEVVILEPGESAEQGRRRPQPANSY